jgi:hypothetical protein
MIGSISGSSPCTCFHAGFLFGLFFNPENGANMFLYPSSFSALHDVTSQKREPFILLHVDESMYATFNHCQIINLDIKGQLILAISSEH